MIRNNRTAIQFSALVFLLLPFTIAQPAVADGDFRVVALTGQPAPSAGAGVTITDLVADYKPPSVNKFGQVAFDVTLSSFENIDPDIPSPLYDTALYSEGGGTGLRLIAKRRDRPPGTPTGSRYYLFGSLTLNDSGAVAYDAMMDGPNVGRFEIDAWGLWSNRSGTNSLIYRAGRPAPGFPPGVDIGTIESAKLNNAGRTAFFGYTQLSSSLTIDSGVYADIGGSFLSIARRGDAAPGLPGTTIEAIDREYWLNDANEMGFATLLSGSQTGWALWEKKPGQTPSLVMRTGTPAPDLPGYPFTNFDCCIEFGGSKSVAFGGRLSGPGVDEHNNEAFYFSAGAEGEVQMLAREGDQAFGLPDGVVFGRFGDLSPSLRTFRAAKVNRRGDILLRAGLRGPGVNDSNNAGIWFGNAKDGFELIARAGEAVPGFPPNSAFSEIEDSAINESGQFAFLASTGWNNSSALWATDRDGNLHQLARLGQVIDVDDGPGVDLRTIRSFLVTNELTNHDTNSIALGQRGHIAFRVEFTDGKRALLVSSAVAVPEPVSFQILLLGCTCVALGRRSRFRHSTKATYFTQLRSRPRSPATETASKGQLGRGN